MTTRVVAALVAATIFTALGCSADQAGQDTAQAAVGAAPGPQSVHITSPAEGDTVSGTDVRVTMSVEGVRLVPVATPPTSVEGEGHLHLIVNRDGPANDAPIPVDSGIVHLGTGASEYVFPTLAPGPYRIIVVFALGTHVPAAGVARDTVNIVVR